MRKLLAVIFFPQILIWPRNKYPELYTLNNGQWTFNNRAAMKRCWKRSREYVIGVTVLSGIASAIGYSIYLELGDNQSNICMHYEPDDQGETYIETTFTFVNGTQKTYRQFIREGGRTRWISDNLQNPSVEEVETLNAFADRHPSVGRQGICNEL